jgi:hypothetical protein
MGVMQEGRPDSIDETLKTLSHTLEESRRLRENLQYMPAATGVWSPPAQESAEQGEEVLLAASI